MPCARSWRGNATANVAAGAEFNGLPDGSPHIGGPNILLIAAACLVATVAFWAYTRTLLPGVDLGDSGGFQAAVLWPENSARRAYPLYYTLAAPFIRAVSAGNPARGLNLFSAIWAAIAVGLLAYLSGRLTKSAIAGAAAGLLLAFSYTFWTQAIIAEVYSLHLALVAACLLALSAFATRPTSSRLAIFFALYAVAFGNHLGMILFLVPFMVFLMQVHPRPRELVAPSTILLALRLPPPARCNMRRTSCMSGPRSPHLRRGAIASRRSGSM